MVSNFIALFLFLNFFLSLFLILTDLSILQEALPLQVKLAIESLENCLSGYSRVRILTTTLLGAYVASALYEAYRDGDCKSLYFYTHFDN